MALTVCLLEIPAAAAEPPQVSAEAAIVMHADTGTVLWEKNADAQMLIASTTKIMTALIAVENCDLGEEVTILPEWAAVEGSSMYLKAGETYTLEELLYGMMLSSGNDAATAVACHVAGDVDTFAALMNEKAAELGLSDTSFENPHGLDSADHHSTARDMATLAAYAMGNADFARIVSTRNVEIKGLTYVNHNKLLWQCEGVIGVKTGYTMAAGRTLVSCCERDGTRYICVTLNDRDDWDDHRALYEWAFGEYSYALAASPEKGVELPLVSETGETVTVYPEKELRVLVCPEDVVEYNVKLPRFLFPGLKAGTVVGEVEVTVNGQALCSIPYVIKEDLPLPGTEKETLSHLGLRGYEFEI